MRRSALAVIVLSAPALQSCGVAACCWIGTHPLKTANAIEYGAERIDPRRRAEEFKRVAEGDLRDRDFTAYVAFVVSELRLKDVLALEMGKEGYTFGYRLDTVDGFAGPDGYTATARLEVLPDYGKLVNEGVKSAFGIWGKLLPDSLVTRIGRDLTLGNRFAGQFLDLGVDEADVDLFLTGPGGTEIPLGVARTDVAGRATINDVHAPLPADLPGGAYPLGARLSPTHRAPGMRADTVVTSEGGGLLFVRRAGDPAPHVVVVNVSNTVFDLSGPKAIWGALREQKYELMDPCTQPALQSLARTHQLVFLSGNPEGMAPMMRGELARRGLVGAATAGNVPLIFKPNDIALEHERMAAWKTRALMDQKKFWGAVDGYIADDPDIDHLAADAAGVPFLALPRPADGGWCAGVAPMVAPGLRADAR